MSSTVNGDCCVSLMQGTLVRPIARYPASIATDDPLKVASNRVRTSLVRSVGSGDTLFTVGDASRIVPQMLLSVDSEIVSVSAVDGNILTVIRGFDGTQPCPHSAGSTLDANIVAWHHNVLAAEITAIETFLGPNGSNIGGTESAFVLNTQHIFAAQSPGGALTAGNNVITLTPVPKGVNGTDTNHYLYISGGTGTAEAVLITGGTAVSGAATGTVIVNCANAHSGAWTVQSASAGIVEAVNTLGAAGGSVWILPGQWPIYGPIVVAKSYVHFRGLGRAAVQLMVQQTSGPGLSFTGTDQNTVCDLQLTGPGSGTTFAIALSAANNFAFKHCSVIGFANGISITGYIQGTYLCNVLITGIKGDGIFVNTPVNGGTWDDVQVWGDQVSTTSKGIHVVQAVGINIVNCYVNGCAYGLTFEPATGIQIGAIEILNLLIDGFNANSDLGIVFNPATNAEVSSVFFTSGGSGGFKQHGVIFTGTGRVRDVVFNKSYICANWGVGIVINTGTTLALCENIILTDVLCEANSTPPGAAAGLLIQGASRVLVKGGVYAAGSYGGGDNRQNFGIQVGGATADVLIQGAVVTPNLTGGIFIAGSNPGLVIKDCIGYNPRGQSPITVGASPFVHFAGPTPETVYIQGPTVTQVKLETTMLANTAPATGQSIVVPLQPNARLEVVYSGAAPTMYADVA